MAKSVSLQPSGFSSNNSTNNSSSTTSNSSNNSVMVEQQKSTTNKSKDALSTCDSSSEVSDEGYKSSQGNVNNAGTSPNGIRSSTDLSSCNKSCANSSETSSHEGKVQYSTKIKVHSNLNITNKSIRPFLFTKSSKWDLGFVYYILKFTISRFECSIVFKIVITFRLKVLVCNIYLDS